MFCTIVAHPELLQCRAVVKLATYWDDVESICQWDRIPRLLQLCTGGHCWDIAQRGWLTVNALCVLHHSTWDLVTALSRWPPPRFS